MENPTYHANLANFFSFLDGDNYDPLHEFSVEDLSRATRADLVTYFKVKCFGTPTPDFRNQDLRCGVRLSTLAYWKKSISKFYRNDGVENITQGPQITEFLKRIQRMETRGKGQVTQARIPFRYQDFVFLIELLKQENPRGLSDIRKYGIPSMLAFQFSMICRFDDATQWLSNNLQYSDRFPQYALKARLVWSKNVHEERDAPWQILLGCVSVVFCVLINLGIWLEYHLSTTPGAELSPYVFNFSHDINIPLGGEKAKNVARNILAPLFRNPYYRQQKVGTHSIRKFAATHCRNSSISKDDVDSRGRWKNTGRVSDRYQDPTLPFVDIKVCLALCQGDACAYVAKAGCITPDFICTHVCPNIEAKYSREVAIVLGSAITWTIFSSSADMVPELLRNRVIAAYNELPERLPDGENPIARKRLLLTGDINNFMLTEIDELEINGAVAQGDGNAIGVAPNGHAHGAIGHGAVGQGGIQHFMMVNTAQNRDLQRTLEDHVAQSRDQIENLNARMLHMQHTLTTFVNHYNRRPHVLLQAAAQAAVPIAALHNPQHNNNIVQNVVQPQAAQNPALLPSLSPSPKTLHILWEEWEHGIGGRKATSLWNEHERGQRTKKSTFSRRNAFWSLIRHLIHRGISSDDAINRIYSVYGHNLTVSQILDRIIDDRKNNTFHVTLR